MDQDVARKALIAEHSDCGTDLSLYSLDGFFQENGPIVWQPGTYAPTPNPYSWANLTNMLYVEQPVGTGYSTGKPVATTQEETAADFVKFFKNWQQIFGIKNYKIYVTGESYAGRYVPYISAAILDQKVIKNIPSNLICCFRSSETKALQIRNNAPELTGAFRTRHTITSRVL